MLITSTISSDLMTPGFPPLVYAVQGEQYSRQITMHLYDGGLPWTVPGGVYIAMRYSKPDGTKGYYDTLPDGSRAWSASGNQVNIFVAPQMLAVPGFVTAQLEVSRNQSILASFSLRLKVEANPAAALQQSEDYVNWLKWMEDQLKQALKDAAASGEFSGPAPTLETNSTQYQTGTSPQTPPTGEWLDNVPSVPQGQYLWTKHTSKWNNSSPVTEYSVAYQGQDGTDAQLEIDTVDYQIGTSGSTPPSGEWGSTIPTPQPGKYFWTRRTKKWNAGTAKVDYSVAYAGTNGTSATVQTQTLEYQVGADGQTPPSGAWSPEIPTVPQGQYLWMRYTLQFNTGSPTVIQMPTYQGINGTGAVSSVSGISPDPQGDVPLSAADVGALPTSGGTMAGPINMNGQPISGLNPPTEGAHAANKGYVDGAVRKAAPRNLMGNSYFRNPVAQAGLNGLHGTRMYACDRWPEEGLTVTQSEAGLQFSVPSFGFIYQKIVEIQRKTVTLGYKTSNTSQVQVALYDGALTSQISVKSVAPKNGIVTSVFAVPGQYDIVSIVLYPANGEIIEWVALYEGAYTADTFPEYQPKGYAQEFTECSRYYTRVHAEWISGDAVGEYGLVARVTCPAPMRILPTVLIDGVSAYVNNAWVELGPPSCRYIGAGMYDVVFDYVSGVEAGRSYLLRGLTGLNADL